MDDTTPNQNAALMEALDIACTWWGGTRRFATHVLMRDESAVTRWRQGIHPIPECVARHLPNLARGVLPADER